MAHGLMGPVVLPHASSQYTLVVPSHRRCRLQSRSAWSHSRRSTLPAKTLTIAHGTASAATAKKPRPGEKKGFVEEMRFVAMRLHTKDQAPKEGGQEAAPQPFQKWQPTKEGYLKFLVESKEVFQTMEDIVQEASHPEYAKFQNTGLERSQPLAADVAWFKETYGLTAPQPEEDGPGQTYSRLLKQLAVENPPAFICHFYNIYFAHSAGGRMIGKKGPACAWTGRSSTSTSMTASCQTCWTR